MATIQRTSRIIARPGISSKSSVAAIFLQLPRSYRAFHASPRPQFLDTVVTATHTILESLHAFTGLPWAYTLPLAAFAIRTTTVLPIAIYSRRATQKQVSLSPLIMSWQHQLRKETMREVGHLGPNAAQSTLLRKVRKKRNEIYKRWGCGQWKGFLPLLQLPIWLVVIETIRGMSGMHIGILGMIAGSNSSSSDAAELGAGGIATGIQIEESFATEGALWFQNLLLPDPQLVLPFMLSGVILLNLTNLSGVGQKQSAFQRRLTNALKIVALAIGPLTLQAPSAVLIYWISSSSIAVLQAALLNKLMPVKPLVQLLKPQRHAALQLDKAKVRI